MLLLRNLYFILTFNIFCEAGHKEITMATKSKQTKTNTHPTRTPVHHHKHPPTHTPTPPHTPLPPLKPPTQQKTTKK